MKNDAPPRRNEIMTGGASTRLGSVAGSSPTTRARGPTMTDVAVLAGVSQTTVSLVLTEAKGARLSDHPGDRVVEAARTLGYRLTRRGGPAPSVAGAIGFVVNEISTDPW